MRILADKLNGNVLNSSFNGPAPLDDAFQAAEEKFHVPKTQWKRLQ
jgi:hypothetical protein